MVNKELAFFQVVQHFLDQKCFELTEKNYFVDFLIILTRTTFYKGFFI